VPRTRPTLAAYHERREAKRYRTSSNNNAARATT
jgi:hypothetical protein